MLAKVQKWGNSLALRLPKVLADEAGVELNSPVNVIVRDHSIVIEPLRKKNIYDLDKMLDEVTGQNLHHEMETGEPLGKEIW